MAGPAFNFGMPALQFKGRIVVIKIADIPLLKPVATRTIRGAIPLELPAVHRLMATRTGRGQARKAHRAACPATVIFLVAGHAFLPGVGPLQGKIRQTVVEAVFLPAFRHMAILTGLLGVILFIEIPLMDIFMAVHAPLSNASEGPFFIFQVAGKTGRRQMGAIQRELCFAVVFESK